MADPDRNAALYALSDGYDVAGKGINGRRVAGQSFLQGYFRHADVDQVVSVSDIPRLLQNPKILVSDDPEAI
ncbi:hypothetical protein I3V23_00335 [Rhodobacterales bacterium HKCCA1288]|jgi:hypothetical protein|nr:hypothetical protein I3V23_00335 [Rhodobacterales bacterium HKCCA1288]